uniref:Chromo domain-containing protein n=1 Tax=Rhabditophanes sp. KR3021 TaxID=114890 RepID=A0AC35TGB2_9BILA
MSSQETDEDDKQVGVYKILRTRGRDHTFQGLVWWENELRKDATWEDVDNNLDNNYAFNEYIANNKNLLKKTRNELVHRNVKVILNEINLTGMPENLKRLSCPKTTIPRSPPDGITCLSSPQNMVCLSFPPTISGHSCSREENRPQCLKVSVPPSISETFSTQSCSEGKINQFVPKSVDSSLGSERIRHSRIPEKTIVVSSSESDYSNDEEETEK